MQFCNWLSPAFGFYFMGYLHRWFDPVSIGKLLIAPTWFFKLYASPKNKHLPKNVMAIRGVFFQTTGMLILVYGFVIDQFIIDKELSWAIGGLGNMVLSYAITMILYKKWRYDLPSQ